MKTLIINLLKEHPTGLTLEEIAMYFHTNPFHLITILDELHKNGLVSGRQNEDDGKYYYTLSAV